MPNWTPNDLKKQFNRANGDGWVAFFDQAGKDYKFSTHILMAVSSRETNIKNIIGDGGHGYGLMQIDDRSFPDWCHSGVWEDANAGVQKGALVLDDKRESVRNGQGKTLKVKIGGKDVSFVGKPNLTPAELLQTALAAYNSGLKAYYGLSVFDDPDRFTTQKDYSADTLARAAVFKSLISN
jgi:hypothetical protein